MFCDKPFHPASHSHSHSISMFGIYHGFPSFFLFPKRSLHRTNGNVFRPEPSLVSLLSLIFLFLFSVVLLFFILASAINKWNVCTQNAYYYFCIYFTPTRIFHRLTLSIFMFLSGLQIYEYQISLECLSFIYLYHLLCSFTALHWKHSISRFDQQFHNKIFKSSHFYVFSVHFVSFPIFLLSLRYYLLQRFCHLSDTLMEILHLCCDL